MNGLRCFHVNLRIPSMTLLVAKCSSAIFSLVIAACAQSVTTWKPSMRTRLTGRRMSKNSLQSDESEFVENRL